jgi:nucleoside-diphosphate-sugar epimerase
MAISQHESSHAGTMEAVVVNILLIGGAGFIGPVVAKHSADASHGIASFHRIFRNADR